MSETPEAEIDPAWWTSALGPDSRIDGHIVPELISSALMDSVANPEITGLQRRVVEALSMAASAILEPDNWQEPFAPATRFGDRRSALPDDLDADQLSLLALAAPLIEQPILRARVADVAWFYGDRRNLTLLEIAVKAYESIPLEQSDWQRVGRKSWRRAIELTMRRGKAGRVHLEEIRQIIQARVLSSKASDGYLVVDLSDLIRRFFGVGKDVARTLADHCAVLANSAAVDGNLRLARKLERQAAAWFAKCGDGTARLDCIKRVSDSYVADADERIAGDESASLAASMFVEKAISTLRELPRKYRVLHDLESRLADYRARLSNLREATLEEMTTFESEAIDLAQYAAGARARVAGRSKLDALVILGQIHPLINAKEAYEAAREVSASSISHLLSRSTFSSDGRKVASSPGALPGDADGVQVRLEVVRSFSSRIAAIGQGFILPAKEVIIFEHHYSQDYIAAICEESPVVLRDHAQLWARGLWHGLNDDYLSAASILVPQIEHLVRVLLKQRGVHTQAVDDDNGVESEKGLGALLEMPEAAEMLGADLHLELQALMTEQAGPNLRNHVHTAYSAMPKRGAMDLYMHGGSACD